jgi:hypothetical protein
MLYNQTLYYLMKTGLKFRIRATSVYFLPIILRGQRLLSFNIFFLNDNILLLRRYERLARDIG